MQPLQDRTVDLQCLRGEVLRTPVQPEVGGRDRVVRELSARQHERSAEAGTKGREDLIDITFLCNIIYLIHEWPLAYRSATEKRLDTRTGGYPAWGVANVPLAFGEQSPS